MPLTMAGMGEEHSIKKVGGNPQVRQFLENLGFVVGAGVAVISKNGGNVIVRIRDSRVAVSREMAARILI
ncbi:MAG: ferrous iron transport protein A [Lachnospiraceae bacterium]|jgi:ferrous iron transport protein A|nr:ferrous iron transport protein A [Lachnospiraceae bacterium]